MRQPRILLHVDERRRDVAALCALQLLLEEGGARVTVSTRRTTPLLARRGRYEAVILPAHDQLPSDLCERLSRRSRIYFLPTEGAWFGERALMIKYGGGYDSELWGEHVRRIRKFFLWGEYSRKVLLDTGLFRDDQLEVLGGIRMDYFLAQPLPEEAALHDPRSLGTISNFLQINPYLQDNVFNTVDRMRTRHGLYYGYGRHIEDRYWIEVARLRVWFEFLEECRRRGEGVSLRIHPRESLAAYGDPLSRYPNVLTLADQEIPFESWLLRLGVPVGFNSTTFFEVVAAGRPGVSLEGLIGPRLADHADGFLQYHYPIMDFIETPTTLDQLFRYVEKVRAGEWSAQAAYGPEAQALLRSVCLYPRPFSTLSAVVRMVLSDLGADAPGGTGGLLDAAAHLEARALEWVTFRLRRHPVTSFWFPWTPGPFRRKHAIEIARYLRAARSHPFSGSSPAPREAAVSVTS